jgi:hypothetical protein
MARQLASWGGHSFTYYQNQAYPALQSTGRKVSAFSDTADWFVTAEGVMPTSYAGGNVEFIWHWTSWTATTGNARWGVEFERLNAGGNRTDTQTWSSLLVSNIGVPTPLSSLKFSSFGSLTPANVNNIAAGESFRIRLTRVGSNAGDTLVGLAYLNAMILNEV